jgi:hypothetical protein
MTASRSVFKPDSVVFSPVLQTARTAQLDKVKTHRTTFLPFLDAFMMKVVNIS